MNYQVNAPSKTSQVGHKQASIPQQTAPYLYWEGLQQLAQEVTGHERIHMGIRPYELHAGNVAALVAYPYLLCEAVRERGVEPQFTFLISINDWEQDELVGQDIYMYHFDTYPRHSNIGHTSTNDGENTVVKWQPIIEKEVRKLSKDFPKVKLQFVRNSSLKNMPKMRYAVLDSITNFRNHKDTILRSTGSPTIGDEMRFANAICSACDHANTQTDLAADGQLLTQCQQCGLIEKRPYEQCDFWMYHKQLFAGRLAVLNFDIAISGADHFREGDFESRRALYECIYNEQMPSIKMLFAPLILASDGKKMSKSRKNNMYRSFEEVLPLLRQNKAETIQL